MLKKKYKIKADVEKVWNALVNPKIIEEWSGSKAKMSEKLETFELWSGDIYGKNIEVEKNKKLVQEWYGGKWEKPSILTITLNKTDYGTEVVLIHKDVPKEEEKDFDKGWDDYYFFPIKELLEE